MKTIADPALGSYALFKEETNQWVWATRTGTPQNPTIDDVLFSFEQTNDNTCTVVGKSRRQKTSLYDYDVNFCNIYNVLRSDNVKFTPV